MDAGLNSVEEFVKFKIDNMDEFLEAKKKRTFVLLFKKLRVANSQRPKGKAIGRSSFWQRQPFDYSDRERDIPNLIPTVSVLKILHLLIVQNFALKTMSALIAEIQIMNATLIGKYVQVSG